LIKDYYWLITTISFIICIFLFTVLAHAGGKIYEPKDPKYGQKKQYTRQQLIQRGNNDAKKYTTCRLMKRIKSRTTGRQACIYIGGNKTFTLMYEDKCPASYKCEYNPWSKEPSIDDVIDSLNSIKKGK
tara:strand:- start:1039 stop:1425 length:387 start_codon:yes stop_codon:yes gene_type:complete